MPNYHPLHSPCRWLFGGIVVSSFREYMQLKMYENEDAQIEDVQTGDVQIRRRLYTEYEANYALTQNSLTSIGHCHVNMLLL